LAREPHQNVSEKSQHNHNHENQREEYARNRENIIKGSPSRYVSEHLDTIKEHLTRQHLTLVTCTCPQGSNSNRRGEIHKTI